MDVVAAEEDGSPSGAKTFVLWNPPVVREVGCQGARQAMSQGRGREGGWEGGREGGGKGGGRQRVDRIGVGVCARGMQLHCFFDQ